jgi:hypothetical protein
MTPQDIAQQILRVGDVVPFPVPQILQDGAPIAPDQQLPRTFWKTYRGPLFDLQNRPAPVFPGFYPANDASIAAAILRG